MKWVVEGSSDGREWIVFAMVKSIEDAREKASACIKNTKHTHVRIVGGKSNAPF